MNNSINDEDYFKLDTLENAIDSLKMSKFLLETDNKLKWKWVSACLLHSLYLFCIDSLECGNYDNVLTYSDNEDNERYILKGDDTKWKRSRMIYLTKSGGYSIKWDYIDGEPSFPKNKKTISPNEKYLISFWTAFARVQDNEIGSNYIFSKPISVTDEQWKSLDFIYERINTIFYYVPCLWIFDVDEFRLNLIKILPIIEHVIDRTNIIFSKEHNTDKIKNILHDIDLLLNNKKLSNNLPEINNNYSNTINPDVEVFSEGENRVYLKKAMDFFYPNLNIEFKNSDSKSELCNFFKLMIKREIKNKTFFLFDCDAKKEFMLCKKIKNEYLIPLILPQNKNNNKVTTGIENMFDEKLFEDRFYHTIPKQLSDGGNILKTSLNKSMFCQFICEERNNKNDFIKFKPILKEIVDFINS